MRKIVVFYMLLACLFPSEALPQNTQSTEDLHAKAESLIVENRFKEAAWLYQEIMLQNPNDDLALAKLGALHELKGDLAKAEEYYTAALSVNPDNGLALGNLSNLKHPDGASFYDDMSLPDEAR